MTDITLDILSKTYPGAQQASVDRLSANFARGKMTALLGPSGCGKTTVLKIIAGLLAPNAGDVRLDGRSVLKVPPELRKVVMVFQDPLLFTHMSVSENIGFGLRMRGRDPATIAKDVAAMLDLVQLPGLGARRAHHLSGGQQKRVALARALILRPEVLLLDEPLSNLDAGLRGEMRDLIRGLQRTTGITTIFVTHDQQEAVELADDIALMLEGRLIQHASPEVFYRRPTNMQVARFFGGANFVPGEVIGGVFHCALGQLQLPAGIRSGPGNLTIRPESIRLGTGAENTVRARIAGSEFLGTQTRLTLVTGTTVLAAIVPPDSDAGLTIGMELDINLPRAALWVLD